MYTLLSGFGLFVKLLNTMFLLKYFTLRLLNGKGTYGRGKVEKEEMEESGGEGKRWSSIELTGPIGCGLVSLIA